MNPEIDTLEWVPDLGCSLRQTGTFFDAVRVAGESGHEVATELAARCEGEPGPVIGELLGERWLYFVLPPGTVASYGWPSLAQVYAAPPVDTVTWMGVPALSGDTWPLFWFARPTLERPFVEARMLHRIVREVAGRDA